jgi:hypothetical protein
VIDIKKILESVNLVVNEEETKKAIAALVAAQKRLIASRKITKNIEREIADLTQSITDGSFTG